jgi:hypothetical protein
MSKNILIPYLCIQKEQRLHEGKLINVGEFHTSETLTEELKNQFKEIYQLNFEEFSEDYWDCKSGIWDIEECIIEMNWDAWEANKKAKQPIDLAYPSYKIIEWKITDSKTKRRIIKELETTMKDHREIIDEEYFDKHYECSKCHDYFTGDELTIIDEDEDSYYFHCIHCMK